MSTRRHRGHFIHIGGRSHASEGERGFHLGLFLRQEHSLHVANALTIGDLLNVVLRGNVRQWTAVERLVEDSNESISHVLRGLLT